MSSRSSSIGSGYTSPATPRVGGVRCYWALLKPRYPSPHDPGSKLELTFVHPDPVLSVHLAKQKMTLQGRGVIEFIHPSEREQARKDLAGAIASDDLQGSVTRVRFARLSRLRIILGCKPEEVEYFENHEKVVEDDEWMVLDLVLNWVADGLLLAFFHAIKDLDPIANNDPHRVHEGWSNFCGTAHMPGDQIDAMQENISSTIAPPLPSRFPPTRIFQLHTTEDAPTRPGELVFSWPTPRPLGSTSQGDGSYNAEEYTNLMKGVAMDPASLSHSPNEVRKTCTTRFGATHAITSEGVYRHVTSVFIPYGSLIFSCFQTTKLFELSPRASDTHTFQLPQHSNLDWPSAHSNQHQQILQQPLSAPTSQYPPSSQTLPPMDSSLPMNIPTLPPPLQSMETPPHSTHMDNNIGSSSSSDWRDYPPLTSAPSTGPLEYYDERNYMPETPIDSQHHHHRNHNQMYDHQNTSPNHQHSPYAEYSPHRNSEQISPVAHHNSIPTYIPTNNNSQSPYNNNHTNSHNNHNDVSPTGANGPGQGRPLVRPPGNVDCCVMCGIRESPEWRRNESGIKDLCNACGLRLARQVAKREGRQRPRKKKEKS